MKKRHRNQYSGAIGRKYLRVLRDGPATTGEVALELGLSVNLACANLSHLLKLGAVTRQNWPTNNRRRRFLWMLPTYQENQG